MAMQGKRTRASLWFPVLLSLGMFMPVSLLSAAATVPADSSELSRVSVSSEFGGFDLEISPNFRQITLFSVRLEEYRCGGITVTGQINAQGMDIWPVVNNQFNVDVSLGIYKIIISGVINSDRTGVCGTWVIEATGTTCSGTWEFP